MVRYFINDTEIQLKPDTVIALTIAYFDLIKLTETQSSFTNTFDVQLTDSNSITLGNINLITSDSSIPYEFLISRIEINGFNFYGKSVIESFTDNAFQITFYGEVINIFDLVNELEINQLDLSEYNHTWNGATVIASRNNNEGYIYPIIDWSDDLVGMPTDNTADCRYLLPCFYIKTIVDKIFEKIGYTAEGDVFSNVYYENLICTLQTKITEAIINKHKISRKQQNQIEVQGGRGSNIIRTFFFPIIIFDPYFIMFYSQQASPTMASYVFKPKIQGQFTIKFHTSINRKSFTIYGTDGTPIYQNDQCLEFIIRILDINQNILFEYSKLVDYQTDNVANNGGGIVYNIDFEEEITVNNYIYLEIEAIYSYNWLNDIGKNAHIIIYNSTFQITNIVPSTEIIEFGNEIDIATNLPELTASDILKTIKYIFAQYITVDSFAKKVYFKSLNDLKDRQPIGWTDKFVRLESIEFHTSLAQNNILKYKEDEDVTDGLGAGNIYVNDTTLEKRKTLIEIPFSATEKAQNLETWHTLFNRISIYKKNEVTLVIERIKEFKDRLLILNKVNVELIDLFTYTTPYTPVIDNIPYTYFISKTDADFNTPVVTADRLYNGLDFPNIVQENYDYLNYLLDKFKKVTAIFRLTELDIVNFDISNPVYIKQLGNKFFVNSIKEFKGSEEFTEVELIKL